MTRAIRITRRVKVGEHNGIRRRAGHKAGAALVHVELTVAEAAATGDVLRAFVDGYRDAVLSYHDMAHAFIAVETVLKLRQRIGHEHGMAATFGDVVSINLDMPLTDARYMQGALERAVRDDPCVHGGPIAIAVAHQIGHAIDAVRADAVRSGGAK